MRKDFTLADITKRIMLVLPVRFTQEESSNVYKFFETLSHSFQIDADKIDELIAQTNLTTATGSYLDQYIQGLAGFGRLKNSIQDTLETESDIEILSEDDVEILTPGYQSGVPETDTAYRDRYLNVLYTYDSTKTGLRSVIIDFAFQDPKEMYSGSRRGGFYSSTSSHSKYFFNDPVYSHYGSGDPGYFTGYIELAVRPDEELIDQLCLHVENAKAYGIQLYIKYPLVGILDGSYVYSFTDEIVTRDLLSIDQTAQAQNVTATDSLSYIIISV